MAHASNPHMVGSITPTQTQKSKRNSRFFRKKVLPWLFILPILLVALDRRDRPFDFGLLLFADRLVGDRPGRIYRLGEFSQDHLRGQELSQSAEQQPDLAGVFYDRALYFGFVHRHLVVTHQTRQHAHAHDALYPLHPPQRDRSDDLALLFKPTRGHRLHNWHNLASPAWILPGWVIQRPPCSRLPLSITGTSGVF